MRSEACTDSHEVALSPASDGRTRPGTSEGPREATCLFWYVDGLINDSQVCIHFSNRQSLQTHPPLFLRCTIPSQEHPPETSHLLAGCFHPVRPPPQDLTRPVWVL